MDEREMTEALAAVDQNFHLIRPVGDEMPSIEHVLQKAELAVLRCGISAAGLGCKACHAARHIRPTVCT
jgi:hypothetical protein